MTHILRHTLPDSPDEGVDLLGLDVIQTGHCLLDALLGGLEVHDEDLERLGGVREVPSHFTACLLVQVMYDGPYTGSLLVNLTKGCVD